MAEYGERGARGVVASGQGDLGHGEAGRGDRVVKGADDHADDPRRDVRPPRPDAGPNHRCESGPDRHPENDVGALGLALAPSAIGLIAYR